MARRKYAGRIASLGTVWAPWIQIPSLINCLHTPALLAPPPLCMSTQGHVCMEASKKAGMKHGGPTYTTLLIRVKEYEKHSPDNPVLLPLQK